MKTIAPLADLIGRSFKPCTLVGLLLVSTAYSKAPILDVPEGRIRFCALIALTISTMTPMSLGSTMCSSAGLP